MPLLETKMLFLTQFLFRDIDDADFEGAEIEWKSSDETIATVAGSNDPRKAVVNGVSEGEVTITVTVKKGDKVSEESVTKQVVDTGYKNKPLKLDLETIQSNGGSCKNNGDGSITIVTGGEGAGIALPHTVNQGEKIKVTVKGKFAEGNPAGFRMYPSCNLMDGACEVTFGELTPEGYKKHWSVPGEDLGKIQAACCTVNADRTFEVKDMEFTAKNHAKGPAINLLFRTPADGLIITEVTVTYL